MNFRKDSRKSRTCHIDHSRFSHFLLTRFAVYGPNGEVPSDLWLRERFQLFEDYCLPSVRSQTCSVFRWGLLVSPEFPEWARLRLLSLGFSNDDLIVSHDWRGALAAAPWILKQSSNSSILTTRLDNDDALASSFVKRLHMKVRENEDCVFNFTNGLQVTPSGTLFSFHRSNPFASLHEASVDCVQTVLQVDHDALGMHWKIHQIWGKPAWLQVIHKTNLANTPRGLPFGAYWAARDMRLPSPSRRYPLVKFVKDLNPPQVLIVRIRHLLNRRFPK
jgi:hypothetical protein